MTTKTPCTSLLGTSFRLFVAAAALATSVYGSSYTMVSDAALTDQARLVVLGHVVGTETDLTGRVPFTVYQVAVDRQLKGNARFSTIPVRVPGGVRPDGIGYQVSGAPLLGTGDNVLLFLAQTKAGAYAPLHLMLGAFQVRDTPSGAFATRDLADDTASAVRVASAASSAAPAGVRDLARFSAWIENRAAHVARQADYLRPAPDSRAIAANDLIQRTLVASQFRWASFPFSTSTWFVSNEAPSSLAPSAMSATMETVLGSWGLVPNSLVNFGFGGLQAGVEGLDVQDGVNGLLFDDDTDGDEFTAPYSCTTGGILALTGTYYDATAVAPYNGQSYNPALESNTATNVGSDCYFAGHPERLRAVLAREVGHALGLPDTSDRGSAMSPYSTTQGALGYSDVAALSQRYGDGSVTMPSAGHVKLAAATTSYSYAQIVWGQVGVKADTWTVETLNPRTGAWSTVATLAKSATSYTASGLQMGSGYTYRVRANISGKPSVVSNAFTFNTPGE